MFEDQKVELLPERTTMQSMAALLSGNTGTATAANLANFAVGRGARQSNTAVATALAGVAIKLH
jgi:hypothetical protein